MLWKIWLKKFRLEDDEWALRIELEEIKNIRVDEARKIHTGYEAQNNLNTTLMLD